MLPNVTKLLASSTTTPAFLSPINAINNPIPALIEYFIQFGMALNKASRTLHAVNKIKMSPSTNTAANAYCHEYPIPITTV